MEPLWVIYKDAFDIITTSPVNRIKECRSCGWLFLDKSKNNSRTWCNMQSCGSIEKSRRYYYNTKKARTEEAGQD
jgi:predicted RNA-binding Zn ribbon-like protein